MNGTTNKEFGVVSLLDALGTRQRLLDNIDNFINDWNAVLVRLDENIQILESKLNSEGYKTGIKAKDIFDNIQIFYPTDDPRTKFIDLTGSNSVWWSIQHTAELLTNLVSYGITRGIFFRGCISMGYIREYRNGYYSTALIENADLAERLDMIGVIAGPSAMRVLNNKTYFSSIRFFHFIKYGPPIKDSASNGDKQLIDNLALLNLTQETRMEPMYKKVGDSDINGMVEQQCSHRDERVRRRWENTKAFLEYSMKVTDENLFL